MLLPMLTAQDLRLPCEPQPPRESRASLQVAQASVAGAGQPLGPGTGASGRPVWGWVLSTNQTWAGDPCAPPKHKAWRVRGLAVPPHPLFLSLGLCKPTNLQP